MTILITGASGYLGSNLAHDLANEHVVAGTYHTDPVQIPGVESVKMDLLDPASIQYMIHDWNPAVVVHCAAQADVGEAQQRPTEAERINRIGTENLVASLANSTYLIHISTDNVHDGKKGWYDESDEASPINHYGETKLRAEETVRGFGGNWIILRNTLMYGGRPQYRRRFCDQVYDSLKRGERVTLFVDEYRTPLHLSDVTTVIKKLLEKRPSGELFNLGGPDRVSRAEFGELLAELRGLDASLIDKVKADSIPHRAPRPRDLSLRCDKIRSALDIELTSLREGFVRSYE